ncbi:exonuclease domain-containing protein [Sulfurivermis fontis]|jgi:DNA polymerase-3 subunit epsilon|uniref:exonuclease domain-containing protein n=1 Tax=Sulfurivermis fontis TaxID=1972068 RepID=UPI000FD816B3|nr:exonuclease domain-containing protein [Sulfurivermis fontis]
MLEWLLSLDYRRRRLAARTAPGPLRDYLETPFAATGSDCRKLDYLALDLETTGLNAKKDAIISFGWVLLHGTRIELASAQHRLVRQHCAIPEASAVIHHITDDAAACGEDLAAVMADLLPLLAGKVLIAHHARVELGFLDAACEQLYGSGFLIPVIDTQYIAQRSLQRRNHGIRPGEMRLGNLRNRYNLPRYRAHNALTDALAAAELFLAQLAERDGSHPLPLKDLMLRP